MKRFVAVSITALVAVTLAACTSSTRPTGSRAPTPTSSASSPSPATSTDTFVLRGDDVCRAFDDAALTELNVTAPTRTPEPGGDAPVCVFPSADIAKNGSVALQIFADTTLETWSGSYDTVLDTDVDGLPAASASSDALGCSFGVEVGGGVLSVGGGGTDTDCRDLAPVASLAVAGLRALQ